MEHRTPPTSRQPARKGSRFTATQRTILVVIGLLNVLLIALGIAAWSLLRAAGPSPQAAQPTLPPSAESPLPSQPAQSTQFTLPQGCDPQPREAAQATVTRVVDAATLEVDADGVALLVTFAGIQPPETDEALRLVQQMTEGQPVTLVKDGAVETGDARYIFAGDRFLNYELVRLGLARLQPDSPQRACAGLLQQAEQQARAGGIGIWQPASAPTATFIPFVTLDPNTSGSCDCSVRWQCSDFQTHEAAQACFNLCNDYSSKLDEDRDGIACENLP